ncbi:MAG TPA: M48 family metalloprotease [Phycisphaerales bacterium]|nr:M48 family metalloprotease [Phycisphaerales bacterium]
MIQLWVIVLFAAVLGADALGPGAPPGVPAEIFATPVAAGFYLLGLTLLAGGGVSVLAALSRRVDRRGSFRAVRAADRVARLARWMVVAWHAWGLLGHGLLWWVRGALGDLVLLDELACLAPASVAIVVLWWAQAPVDLALRRAVLVRNADEGRPIYPEPSRAALVAGQVRQAVAMAAGPMALLIAWSELARLIATRLARAGWLGTPGSREAALVGLYLVGLAVLFVLGPILMRLVWDTIPLGPGPLRERLLDMARREGVRVRELLIWRTGGTVINGAVLGASRWARYVLLTDALLDALPGPQLEAVMAHELAHARLRHMPWMLAGLAVSLAGGWLAAEAAWDALGGRRGGQLRELVTLLSALGSGLLVLGWISRRMERQADAFAAGVLSAPEAGVPAVVTPAGVAAMKGALGAVALLNGVAAGKWTWRHGSIAGRQRRLDDLVGHRIGRLPIDVTIKLVKGAIVLAGVAVGTWVWLTETTS